MLHSSNKNFLVSKNEIFCSIISLINKNQIILFKGGDELEIDKNTPENIVTDIEKKQLETFSGQFLKYLNPFDLDSYLFHHTELPLDEFFEHINNPHIGDRKLFNAFSKYLAHNQKSYFPSQESHKKINKKRDTVIESVYLSPLKPVVKEACNWKLLTLTEKMYLKKELLQRIAVCASVFSGDISTEAEDYIRSYFLTAISGNKLSEHHVKTYKEIHYKAVEDYITETLNKGVENVAEHEAGFIVFHIHELLLFIESSEKKRAFANEIFIWRKKLNMLD